MSPKRTKLTPQPRLVVISAPSGAGKTTLSSMLLNEFSQLQRSVSTTTRAKRDNEKTGIHYFFVDDKTFQNKIENSEFAEWAEVHGRRYGTSKQTIETILKSGKHPVFDIDVKGAMNLRDIYGDRVLLIFIHPPSMEILKERLTTRSLDSLDSIENRLKNAYSEIEWSRKYDYQIINDELKKAYDQLKKIIQKECL